MSPPKILIPTDPPSPLDPSVRSDLFSALIRQNTIKDLHKTLNNECQTAGWQQKVQERILQLLRTGEVKNMKELEDAIVSEALGREDKGDEISDEEGDGGDEADQNNTTREKPRKRIKVNDGAIIPIKLPEKAITAGTKIVRATLEDAVEVEVEEEQEMPVWREWR
ncbi:MAG: hypothetical protein Q9164_000260 [Protoblastenia rupestris]